MSDDAGGDHRQAQQATNAAFGEPKLKVRFAELGAIVSPVSSAEFDKFIHVHTAKRLHDRFGSIPTDAWIMGRAAPQCRHRLYRSVKGTNDGCRPANLFESLASMSAQEQIEQREDADRGEKYDRGEKWHQLHVCPSEDEVQPSGTVKR